MAIIFTSPSQSRAVGLSSIPFSGVDPASKTLRVTLTREAWPAGLIATAIVTWADGSGGSFSVSGNPAVTALASVLEVSKAQGQTSGTVDVNVLQVATTAITIETL